MHLLMFLLHAQIKRWRAKNEVWQKVQNFFTSVKLWHFTAILCSLSESLQEVVYYVRLVWPPNLNCNRGLSVPKFREMGTAGRQETGGRPCQTGTDVASNATELFCI